MTIQIPKFSYCLLVLKVNWYNTKKSQESLNKKEIKCLFFLGGGEGPTNFFAKTVKNNFIYYFSSTKKKVLSNIIKMLEKKRIRPSPMMVIEGEHETEWRCVPPIHYFPGGRTVTRLSGGSGTLPWRRVARRYHSTDNSLAGPAGIEAWSVDGLAQYEASWDRRPGRTESVSGRTHFLKDGTSGAEEVRRSEIAFGT